MNRRSYLAAVCSAGVVTTLGCGTMSGKQTLSNPTVEEESPGRRSLLFAAGGEDIGSFGVGGSVEAGQIALSTELWHREGTTIESIRLRLWMPETAAELPAEVAVVSPVEGDSSPPPSVALYTPDRDIGTVIEITDLDDLADETIDTLDLLVKPGAETATGLTIDVTITLTGDGVLSDDYTLTGELDVEYPELTEQQSS